MLVVTGLVVWLPRTSVPEEAAGTPLTSGALRTELESLAASRPHSLRTRHVGPDGVPLYTNRLIRSSSPYLQQHAHNPVDWFAWGPEALELAVTLDRPIFLSIGYATCHWCHVMEEESFEDPEIAALLNAHFIPIKVDRETRPDLDRIYMSAVTAATGRGGWPATLVLHPDQQPFFAATYLPARAGDRGRSQGLFQLLEQIAEDWENNRPTIDQYAARLTQAVRKDLERPLGANAPDQGTIQAALDQAEKRYDPDHGGPKGAPKFPSQLPMRLMLAAGGVHRQHALHTLDQLAAGGIYDHLAGGFHRYSVDEAWDVPHFEKMLYDNALLARTYTEAFQLTGDLRYARVASETLEFMIEGLGADGGGFCSALDADSRRPDGELEEGWVYTWTEREVRALLTRDDAGFLDAYGLRGAPELDGRHVLRTPSPLDLEQRDRWKRQRLQLHLERRKRHQPLRDDKVLTGWNGLAIGSFAYAGAIMGRSDWIDEAVATAERLLDCRVDGRLTRVCDEAGGRGTAFLEDHVFLAEGLLTLFEATGDPRWLELAQGMVALARQHHGSEDGPWYRTPADHEPLLTRDRPGADGAIPSANSMLVGVLLRMSALTGDDALRQQAVAIATTLGVADRPLAFDNAVLALAGAPLREVVLVTDPGERSSGLLAAIKTLPPSRRVLVQQRTDRPPVVPLAEGKIRLDAPTAYVCQGGVCDNPTTDPAQLAAILSD